MHSLSALQSFAGMPHEGLWVHSPAPLDTGLRRELKELGELKSQGVITEEEFAAQKAKLLNA